MEEATINNAAMTVEATVAPVAEEATVAEAMVAEIPPMCCSFLDFLKGIQLYTHFLNWIF